MPKKGLPADPLPGRRHRLRPRHPAHLQDPRGVPRPHHEHIQRDPLSQGVRHGGGALQRHPLRPPAGGEHGRDLLHRQRGALRHLLQVRVRTVEAERTISSNTSGETPGTPNADFLQDPQANISHLRGSQSPSLGELGSQTTK